MSTIYFLAGSVFGGGAVAVFLDQASKGGWSAIAALGAVLCILAVMAEKHAFDA